ncbi:MAG: hypothetical protein ACLQJ7_03425 [Syntrophobacteraceae bacterium]
MTRFKFLFFVALPIRSGVLGYAGFNDDTAVYDRGDYAKAYEELKTLAERGTVNGV